MKSEPRTESRALWGGGWMCRKRCSQNKCGSSSKLEDSGGLEAKRGINSGFFWREAVGRFGMFAYGSLFSLKQDEVEEG